MSRCHRPIHLHERIVPCGKCVSCIRRRASEWTVRLKAEYRHASSSAFITFTYNDENLPGTPLGLPTLHYRDMQLFLKRLRKHHGKGIKYYTVGEYGSTTQRPHYHSIMFNLPGSVLTYRWDEERQIWHYPELDKLWQKGHVDVRKCCGATIAYCTGYLQKSIKHSNVLREDDDRAKERAWMSKGLGLCLLSDALKDHYARNPTPYIVGMGGQKQVMPRYYKEKLYTEEQRQQLVQEAADFLQLEEEITWDQMVHETRMQDRKNLLTRQTI